MSQSSLPDIFTKSQTMPLKLYKQPPSFSLNCNKNNQQYFSTIHKTSTPSQQTSTNSPNAKGKSLSTYQPSSKKPNLQEIKEFAFHDLIDKNRMSFFQDQNNRKNGRKNKQLNTGIQKNSFFPYQTNRRFSNNTVQLQEADNLRSKIINQQRDLQELWDNMKFVRENTNFIRSQFNRISQTVNCDLEAFHKNCTNSLKNTYNKLSLLRRQTNYQLKSNQVQLDKTKQDIYTCTSFSNQLKTKTNNLYESCLKDVETASTPQDIKIQYLDFEQISSIKKSSRGTTGELKRGKRDNYISDVKRKSANWQQLVKGNKLMLNGRQIDMLSLQEDN